jgi:hypothetical protein
MAFLLCVLLCRGPLRAKGSPQLEDVAVRLRMRVQPLPAVLKAVGEHVRQLNFGLSEVFEDLQDQSGVCRSDSDPPTEDIALCGSLPGWIAN